MIYWIRQKSENLNGSADNLPAQKRNYRKMFTQKKENGLKEKGLSLRAVYLWTMVIVLVLSGLTFYATFNLTGTFQNLTDATENQISLDKAVHDLMSASDYLTERVQRFSISGDPRFMNEYFTEVLETNRRENAIEKMAGVEGTAAALEQLQEAMEGSKALMQRELYSMRLVTEAKGITAMPAELRDVTLSAEDAALAPEVKMRRATEMVMDEAYYNQKESIRTDLQESLDALEALTRNAENTAFSNVRQDMRFVRGVIIFHIFGTIALIWVTIRFCINPIMKAVDRIRGDRPIEEKGANEFRYLARAYNGLTVQLSEENELLKEISRTDGLTGIRNRIALRDDYDSYKGHEVTVMLLDLDNFKTINDTNGHEEGDRILSETGKLIGEAFGKDHCYRFGGDEFLVILPDCSEAEFLKKLDWVMANRPILQDHGQSTPAGYSVGYVHAVLDDRRNLRDLFAEADQKMYQIKRDKVRAETIAGARNRSRREDSVIRPAEYTTEEMRALLAQADGMYDLARAVDPIECRILEFGSDGTISRKEKCYGIWNADQKCINCSSALACRTGCRQEKAESFNNQLYHIQSNPVRLKLPDGGAYDAVVELVSIEQSNRDAHAANDRAAENKNQRAAQYRARHDTLTKALNANTFSEMARELLVRKPELPWVMITSNIMDFRLVNTLFGTQRGNEAIVRNAAALQQIAITCNGLCGRLGGDQFALLLPKGTYREEMLTEAAAALRDEFSSGVYTFCIHFGVYDVEDPSIPISVMCDRANMALRTIRDDHRETIATFKPEMMKKSLFAQEVISSFEKALAADQFRMYLQPLAAEDGTIIGAEALARWQRPDGTVVTPSDFIETLEHAGMIHRLDVFIWEKAVRQLAAWRGTEHGHLSISVNMSAKDFYSIDPYLVLTELADRYQVPCSHLRIEITETALLEDPANVNEVISRLRQRGFLVEIDDFGKGWSSLGLLKDIQADVLKIDMSLMQEIEHKPRSRIILESIIDMAGSLGMDVICEGVETEEQLNLVKAMGCKHFQGYYFSSPVPPEQFGNCCKSKASS